MTARQYILTKPSQPENVYGAFVNELLKAEGLNGFEVVDVEKSGLPVFGPQDLMVLTRCFLRNAEMDALLAAVEAGARLVCIRPQRMLAERLGWLSENRCIRNSWVRIAAGYPGSGLPIQTHVPMELYRAGETNSLYEVPAEATDAAWTANKGPAVIRQKAGRGEVACFFYDLPKAVARIRFGDPELASCLTSERWDWQHTIDLFCAGFLDERVRHLPQADFHSQLLAKILTDLCPYPLPRWWYYEKASQRSAAVFTSDGDLSMPEQFEELSDCLLQHGGTATFYPMKNTKLDETQVRALREKGHTLACHINPHNATDEWYFDFPRVIDEETAQFKKRFGTSSVTLQCHCAPWQGYMNWLPHFMGHGYRMLMAYLSDRINTFTCGSGRPLKFTDLHGITHDCWQQPIVTYDDSTIIPMVKNDVQSLIDEFDALLTGAVEHHHTAIGMLSHPVSFCTYSRPLMEPCMKRLQEADAPIYNGDEWCAFQDRRHAAMIRVETASPTRMTYQVENLSGPLTLMLPVDSTGAGNMDIQLDGRSVDPLAYRRLEQDYLFLRIEGNAAGSDIRVEVRC